MKKGLALCVFALLFSLCASLSAHAQGQSRALIITSDMFLSAPDTAPSSLNNGLAMQKVFLQSRTPFERISVLSDAVASREDLEQAVHAAFSEADDGDVSYFYLSTHGIVQGETVLLLSDGRTEYAMTATALEEALRGIRGTKVIILDACHSGAFIQKGTSDLAASHPFMGSQYKVVTSSGAQEESFFWHADQAMAPQAGSGYFSDILAMGLSDRGSFGADLDNSGDITLAECHRYLLDNHGVSTPRVYPQNDDFVLFEYDLPGHLKRNVLPDGALENITFESNLFSVSNPAASFEFTVLRPTKLAYQLIYAKGGEWAFSKSHLIYDTFEANGVFGDEKGAVSPGRKVRSLELELQNDDTYGYALLQIVTLSEDAPTIRFSRVLTVPKMGGDPGLLVSTLPAFSPETGQEMPIHVAHDSPLDISVSVLNEKGETVRRLESHTATRPERLAVPGSTFYWDGTLKDGTRAGAGAYQIKVTASYPGESYTAFSPFFALERPGG